MPVLSTAACIPNAACPLLRFPVAASNCVCQFSLGGINDLYFIPCTSVMSETNVLDVTWWAELVEAESPGFSDLGNLGIGLGSITKKSDKKERVGSCKVEQVISNTWSIKYQLKCFDKSVLKVTHAQINALINNSGNYQLIARMCDGDNTVLPVGSFTLSDFNWTVPDNFEEIQIIEIELSWFELAMPKTYNVVGLSAVVPKAA